MMNNFLNGMFGKVGSGMCRLSMNGGIAVKTRMLLESVAIQRNIQTQFQLFLHLM